MLPDLWCFLCTLSRSLDSFESYSGNNIMSLDVVTSTSSSCRQPYCLNLLICVGSRDHPGHLRHVSPHHVSWQEPLTAQNRSSTNFRAKWGGGLPSFTISLFKKYEGRLCHRSWCFLYSVHVLITDVWVFASHALALTQRLRVARSYEVKISPSVYDQRGSC